MNFLFILSQGLNLNADLQEQWQPTPTAHDPNPPITLLNPDNQAMFFLAQ